MSLTSLVYFIFLALLSHHAAASDPKISFSKVESWQQISNSLSIYCFALDSKNYTILDDVFTPDAVAYFPSPLGIMNGSAAIKADLNWDLENITTQHLLGSISIEILGEKMATSYS